MNGVYVRLYGLLWAVLIFCLYTPLFIKCWTIIIFMEGRIELFNNWFIKEN